MGTLCSGLGLVPLALTWNLSRWGYAVCLFLGPAEGEGLEKCASHAENGSSVREAVWKPEPRPSLRTVGRAAEAISLSSELDIKSQL